MKHSITYRTTHHTQHISLESRITLSTNNAKALQLELFDCLEISNRTTIINHSH